MRDIYRLLPVEARIIITNLYSHRENIDDVVYYSALKFLTGLARAALTVCMLIVIKAMHKIQSAGKTNIHTLKSILKA